MSQIAENKLTKQIFPQDIFLKFGHCSVLSSEKQKDFDIASREDSHKIRLIIDYRDRVIYNNLKSLLLLGDLTGKSLDYVKQQCQIRDRKIEISSRHLGGRECFIAEII